MITDNIKKYLDEFFENPYGISGEKITLIKNYFYTEINYFKAIKRKNLQIGATKNKNILHFRDKTNKQYEVILELNSNKKYNFFRKDYNKSYKLYNSFNHNDYHNKKSFYQKLLDNPDNYVNKSYKYVKLKVMCNIL